MRSPWRHGPMGVHITSHFSAQFSVTVIHHLRVQSQFSHHKVTRLSSSVHTVCNPGVVECRFVNGGPSHSWPDPGEVLHHDMQTIWHHTSLDSLLIYPFSFTPGLQFYLELWSVSSCVADDATMIPLGTNFALWSRTLCWSVFMKEQVRGEKKNKEL